MLTFVARILQGRRRAARNTKNEMVMKCAAISFTKRAKQTNEQYELRCESPHRL